MGRPGPGRFPPIRSQERRFGWDGGGAEVLGGGRRLEGREVGWEWREEVVECLRTREGGREGGINFSSSSLLSLSSLCYSPLTEQVAPKPQLRPSPDHLYLSRSRLFQVDRREGRKPCELNLFVVELGMRWESEEEEVELAQDVFEVSERM